MKIKIIHLLSTLERKGPVLVAFNRIRGLGNDVYEHLVVTLSPEPSRSMRDDFVAAGIPIQSLNLSRREGLLYGRRRIKKIVNDWGAHIVQSDGFRADALNVSSKHGAKTIGTIHSVLDLDYIPKFGRFLGRIMVLRHLMVAKKLNAVVACSSTVQAWLKTKDCESVAVLNGVDTDKFVPAKNHAYRYLMRESGQKAWLFAGQLIPRKNVPFLICSFLNSKAIDSGVLYILGDGVDLKRCEEAAENTSKVVFLGFSSDVQHYLQEADYFVSLSLSEGLPMSILEAAAVGLPILMSNIPQHLEIASKANDSCIVVNPQSCEEASFGFNQMMKMNHEDASKIIRSVAVDRFSNSSMAEGYEHIYQRILTL